jgi:hypothetical protein
MTDRFSWIGDAELEAGLLDLGETLAVPVPTEGRLDPARAARLRIEQGAGSGAGSRPGAGAGAGVASRRPSQWAWLVPSPRRRLGRGLAVALLAVLAIAAVAGAIGLGLPGIRIVPAPAGSPIATTIGSAGSSASPVASQRPTATTPSPVPTPADPLGSNLGLGDRMPVADIATAVDIPVVLPTAPWLGSPATAWLREGRLTLVWPASETLPATAEPGVGLVLSQFSGTLDAGYFEKILGQGTTITTVPVDGVTGYWISGAPHDIVYVNDRHEPVFDSRRSVGDTLLWTRDNVTYRLEAGLGRDATVALADTLH